MYLNKKILLAMNFLFFKRKRESLEILGSLEM